jgi:hypothetical protein
MTELVTLDVSGNFLSGTLPASVGQLTNIEDFLGDDNQLTGTIPAEFRHCGNLNGINIIIIGIFIILLTVSLALYNYDYHY